MICYTNNTREDWKNIYEKLLINIENNIYEKEYWINIKDYPNYEISNLGRIKTKKTNKFFNRENYISVGLIPHLLNTSRHEAYS